MTLANAINVKGDDLVHVRRRALLHDIGKIGVPEGILQRRGSSWKQE